MSSYFSLPSFARAKKNKEQLEKTNPQKPVLDDEDEKFLNKQISSSEAPSAAKDEPPTKITEDGEEKPASEEEVEKAGASADQVIVPETQPDIKDGAQDVKPDSKADKAAEKDVADPPEQVPEESSAPAAKATKSKKDKGFELPSQEEAEAATRGFNVGGSDKGEKEDRGNKAQSEDGDKRTWASYLPTLHGGKKDAAGEQKPDEQSKEAGKEPEEPKEAGKEQKDGQVGEHAQGRTWAEYASATYSALPSIPSVPASWKSKDKDSKPEPVYNEDGTINEEKTREKEEREVSVLLDNLNMSSINNRVFAFSGETQKIYERFALVLKDTINGGPTAYEDMEKLMRDAGPELEKQFQSMPPFVQTLVKSLPTKLGTTLGPELLAAASEKPGADMQARMKAASKQSGGDPSLKTAESKLDKTEKGGEEGQKKKRTIPGLKGLVSQQGAVASILRNVVTFLQTRFPFLASTTNVVMSLGVFILMFVFWYCHKRGKEARLAKEAAKKDGGKVEEVEGDDDDIEVDVTDEEGEDEDVAEEEAATGEAEPIAEQTDSGEAVGEKTEKAKEEVLADHEMEDKPAERDTTKAKQTQ
ncbi:hypothetical protein BAUCODRAFT_37803 [Baudoinia panamericana UAMH 10762]|uniref:Uncharacterized protein n=1 Tax=Baudoinia panamericana (strain UAMH 10762) TaxID=717646 RepID=M2LFT2_BAUPA|nr:uncharacterized protein BAUCODRAFT_37803 [Baudoinia panamericana UAMH 10762]EMC92892.1 hypothetical protein BAUCODRAFT_37803 [Baudoinia panamericana UAMH 10762]